MKTWVLCLLICVSSLNARGQDNAIPDPFLAPDSVAQQRWVDATYEAMSAEERIGQLFMVMVASSQGDAAEAKAIERIKEYHLGGIIFSRGGPVRQAQMTNAFQEASKTPLLIGQDAEWGLAMRLDSTFAFPWNSTLGAIRDTSVLETIGYRMGLHARRLGVHINFAPVADVNINPANPIIGNRSFGEDPKWVTKQAYQVMRGMHRAGVLTSAKHFPGHGDTAADSHSTLPTIPFDRARLDSVELYPYPKLISGGLSSVMIAHLNVPALTGSQVRPTSLSKSVIQGVLRKEMGYKGLVFTDALNMKGATGFEEALNPTLEAFLAGNDMLLMPNNLEADWAAVLEAYRSGMISETRLATSVKRILKAKYKVGLNKKPKVALEGIQEDLHKPEDSLAYERAMEEAITILKNPVQLLPIRNLENKRIAYLATGPADHEAFLERMRFYADVDLLRVNASGEIKGPRPLAAYNLLVVGWHGSNASPWSKDRISAADREKIASLAALRSSNTALVVFGKPYLLGDIEDFGGVDALVLGYQNSVIGQETAAELLFGVFPGNGRLPVTAHPKFPVGTSVSTPALQRLGYSLPERVGMDRTLLAQVDTLVNHGLDSLMYPGAQVLIARHGQVIYHKAFGYHTDKKEKPVAKSDIYDLASLTKILATLPVLMQMEQDGEIRLNDTFSTLLPEFEETALKDVTVLKALSHYGRLPAWIAFYIDTLSKDRKPSREFYREQPEAGFSIPVAKGLYLTNAYRDSIYNRIARQDLKSNRYRYSDVAYYVFKKYIEKQKGKRLNNLVASELYEPLGASRTTYLPLNRFDPEVIVPSEEDNYYRYQTIRGYVHDMGAAMQGGVGGHAGLFSDAVGVAKIMQMYLQGGYYGGDRFLESRTIEKFNKCYFCKQQVRRGVGFDKPQLEDKGPTCGCVSPRSFGHSGFTGTYTWADPDEGIVYVFLSNRTYPSASNNLLVRSALRTRIQQAIYDSLIN
ncbi:beta-glucosidase [Robiginitalea myxolifaciens]|uniref:beta-N-acetylhexosaminidase n=1 Tax=Robiginitalea myxolifaciens TaxID=400055 RepID=A0A1I6H240_9FLAO|nr:glycoside hydrolase family 3 N-terminal domain-containing protein [Robiginitalea myxolifaciens]SFR48536.1 beta-glucosidase [Robiginitalea myxolifaciens]